MGVNQRTLQKYYDRRSACKVLGCLMLKPNLIKSRTDIICSDYFGVRTHKVLYEVIEALAKTGQFETITLGDIENWMYNNAQVSYNKFFENGDESEWILNLIEDADLNTYSYYLDIVRKYAFLRDKLSSGQDVSDILDETQLDLRLLEEQRQRFYEMTLEDIIKHYDRKNLDVKSKYVMRDREDSRKSGDDADEIWEEFKKSPDYGWRSGSAFLDRISRGCRRGMFGLESRESGSGKSRTGVRRLCLLSCDELWSYEEQKFIPNPYGETIPTLYIGTEMDLRKEIEPIIWATISGVEEHKIRTQSYTKEEEERLLKAKEISKRSPIYLENEPNYDIEFLYTTVEEHILNHGIGAVIIDYIETTPALISEYARITRGMNISEHQVLFNLSTELKNIAKQYNVYVHAYTQIAEDARRNWEIRDSGAIKGSKSLQMKADLAIVAMKPTEKELLLVKESMARNCNEDTEPNIVLHVYKCRGGSYGMVKIFGTQNLGSMKFVDLFITDWSYKQFDGKDIKPLLLKSPKFFKKEEQQTVFVNPDTGEVKEIALEEEPKPTKRVGRRSKTQS